MSAHRYWRVYITANDGNPSYTVIQELEMRATLGGADQCNGGTPIFSTQNANNPPDNYAVNAFDNIYNSAKRWTTGDGSTFPHYLGYDFGSGNAVEVAEFAITSDGGTSVPKNFQLQYSDDNANWVTVGTYSNQTAWGTFETRLFVNPLAYVGNFSGNIVESLPTVDWLIFAVRCRDSARVGSAFSSGSTYSVDVTTLEACVITLSQKVDYAWSGNKVAAVGDYVVPANPDTTPHLFKIDTGGNGTFGATEPTYNLSGTTVSGTATLTYVGPLVDPISLGPKIPTPI